MKNALLNQKGGVGKTTIAVKSRLWLVTGRAADLVD